MFYLLFLLLKTNEAFKLRSFILSQQINGITSIYSNAFSLSVYPKGSVSVQRCVSAAGGQPEQPRAGGCGRTGRARSRTLVLSFIYQNTLAQLSPSLLLSYIKSYIISYTSYHASYCISYHIIASYCIHHSIHHIMHHTVYPIIYTIIYNMIYHIVYLIIYHTKYLITYHIIYHIMNYIIKNC